MGRRGLILGLTGALAAASAVALLIKDDETQADIDKRTMDLKGVGDKARDQFAVARMVSAHEAEVIAIGMSRLKILGSDPTSVLDECATLPPLTKADDVAQLKQSICAAYDVAKGKGGRPTDLSQLAADIVAVIPFNDDGGADMSDGKTQPDLADKGGK